MTKSRALMATMMIVGVFVLLSGLSAAPQDNMNGNANGNTSGNMGRSANANMSQNTFAKSADGKFMMTAATGGLAEVELGRLALERGSSDAVKQYAQRMVDDHTKANQDLMTVAVTKGVTLPTGPDPKHMALIERLRSRSGADFDRMYIKEAGVKAHQDMEKLFRNETIKGKDPDVMAFASRTLPAVQEHLRMAREMSGTMMGTGSGSGNGNMSGGGNMNGNMNGNSNRNRNTNGNMNGNGNTSDNTNNGNTNP